MLSKTQIDLMVAQYRVMILKTLIETNETISEETFQSMVASYRKKLEEQKWKTLYSGLF